MDTPSIQRALRRRQFFRIGGVVAFFGFIGLGAVTVFAGSALGWHEAPAPVALLMFAFFLFAVAASLYLVAARCPRCGKKFWYDETSTYRNQLTPQCLNCGLPINWKGDNGRAV
jgi:endogenous inhibitor of DNA gyrase (YacG/DUF329 family)